MKHEIRRVDLGKPVESVAFTLRHLGAGRPLLTRARVGFGFGFIVDGRRDMEVMFENHWRAADALAQRLGLSQAVRDSVMQTFERWDGKGEPDALRGDQLSISSRLVNLADVVEVFHRAGGVEAAVAVAQARRGTQFDPGLVDLFRGAAAGLFDELDSVTSWEAVMAAEPGLGVVLTNAELESALGAVADFVDLKSPYTIGHSRAVAELAAAAAGVYGLPDSEVRTLRRASLVHDFGRLGVSNSVWDKQAPLIRSEVE